MNITITKRRGVFLPIILILSLLFMGLIVAIIGLAMYNIKIANNHKDKVAAMEIAEAGINYYLWHLAHDNTDYCDGQSCVGSPSDGYGPYAHDYSDTSGKVIGNYEIKVYPPADGDSIVRIESVGKVNGRSLSRTIISELGMPSFSKYTLFVQGKELWLGPNEKVTGTVFVNHSGICNQGEITGDSYSTEETFNSYACGSDAEGITGAGAFGGSKNFPVPQVEFDQLAIDMTALRNEVSAGTGGLYFNSSGANGYHLVLKADSFDLYRVDQFYGSLRDDQASHSDDLSIRSETLFGSYYYPVNGVIFFEDNVWVNGQIDEQKISIIAYDPEQNNKFNKKSIVINNNVLFSNYNGKDKIGLIAQNFIYARRKAPSLLRVDAAMIAYGADNYGGAIRIKPYCSPSATCNTDKKTKITVFGSMAHRGGLWWTIDQGSGKWSGYESTETIIDESNVLNPPPKFPVTGSFQILSWREK